MTANGPETDDEGQLHQILEERGIRDVESGLEAAATHFRDFLRGCLPLIGGDVSSLTMGLLSMLTRAQAFHDGATAMIHEGNPFATYALIRCYAENAAALVWIAEKPHDARRLALAAGEDEKLVVGRVVDFAATKLPGFKNLYRQLSEYAHPVASSFHAAWHPGDEGERSATWASAPKFKSWDGPLWALLWLMELTDVHRDIWPELFNASLGRTTDVVGGVATPDSDSL